MTTTLYRRSQSERGSNRAADVEAAGISSNEISLVANKYVSAEYDKVDESAKVANLQWEYLPGGYGIWGGSISQLGNGNIEFDVNAPVDAPLSSYASEVQEVTQTSTPQIVWKMDVPLPTNAYRAYRVPSLYPGVGWQD